MGLLLSGGVYASESMSDLKRVVCYPGIQIVKEEHRQELEHGGSVILAGSTDLLEQRQEDQCCSLSERWETLRDLTEPREDVQESVVQRRNARDFTGEGVAQQVSAIPTRRSLVQFLLWCFCISQREDEGDSTSLAVQGAPSVISNSLSLPIDQRSYTPISDTLGNSRRNSLELVDMSSSSKSSIQNRRPPTSHPSMSVSSLKSGFDGESL